MSNEAKKCVSCSEYFYVNFNTSLCFRCRLIDKQRLEIESLEQELATAKKAQDWIREHGSRIILDLLNEDHPARIELVKILDELDRQLTTKIE